MYDPQQVPDLLQTPQYAQAVLTADPALAPSAAPGVLVPLMLARQRVLGERRAGLVAVIGEAALRQVTGRADVMRDQLAALAGGRDRVVVQVVPSGRAVPSGGPATILRFAGAADLGAVYLPGLSGGVCLVGQRDVASYTRAFEHLRASALAPAASARLIGEIAGRWMD